MASLHDGVERKVAEDEPESGRTGELVEVPEGMAAGGALEVGELDDGDRCVGGDP